VDGNNRRWRTAWHFPEAVRA